MQTRQQRLGFFLGVLASLVLLFGAVGTQAAPMLTIRQAYLNLAIAAVTSLLLMWPFPGLVESFCSLMRFSALAAAVLAAVRSSYGLLPPLLLLALVFQLLHSLTKYLRREQTG